MVARSPCPRRRGDLPRATSPPRQADDTASPSRNNGPAYVTAATLAAFAVSGLNVPGAIGAARESGVAASSQQLQQARDHRRRPAAPDPRRSRSTARQPAAGRPSTRSPQVAGRGREASARRREAGPAQVGHPGRALPADRRLRRRTACGASIAHRPGLRGPRAARRSTRSATARSSSRLRRRLRQQDRDPAPRRHRHLVRPHVGLRADQRHGQGRRPDRPDRAAPATRPGRTCTSRSGRTTAGRSTPLPWLRAHGVKL